MGSPPASASADDPDRLPAGRHLGELQRGEVVWTVLLETRTHPRAPGAKGSLQGRLHFVRDGGAARSTGWIFVEPGEPDMLVRFSEFSAVELWHLLDSLA